MLYLCLDLTILDVRWPLLFFSETDFIYNYLHIIQKWTKNQYGKLKKISRFLSTGHGILPSCGRKARETMVAKYELVLWRTSPVDRIHFKALIAIFWDLQPLWPSSLRKPDLLRFRCFSGHVLSKTKSVTPHFFKFLTSLNHYLSMVKFSDKKINVRQFSRERP